MKKATIQQTILLLSLCLLLCCPLGSTAQVPSSDEICRLTLDEISANGGNFTDSEIQDFCNHLEGVYDGVSLDCPKPENLVAIVRQNSVYLSWDPVPQALYYRVTYFNINSGVGNSFNVDVTSTTINNLVDGHYYAMVQSVCGDETYSEPEGINFVIIGDVISIRSEPIEDCNCAQPTNFHNNTVTTPQVNSPWPNIGCQIQPYDLIIETATGSKNYTANIRVTRYLSNGSSSSATYSICNSTSNDMEFRVSQDGGLIGETEGGLQPVIPLFELKLSENDGFFLNPQNGTFAYHMSISHCCNVKEEKKPDKIRPAERSSGISDQQLKQGSLLSAPNPFTQIAEVNYTIQENSEVSLVLYNALGQPVRKLKQAFMQAGGYQLPFDGQDLNPGLYYLHLKTKSQDELLKMIKL